MSDTGMIEGVISFKEYRLFSLDYKCEPAFTQKAIQDGKFTYNFSYGSVDLPNGMVQINLMVIAFFGNDETDADHSPFRISAEIGGKFSTENGKSWNHHWDANAIAILYPYVRSIISSMTIQAGVDPVILPTINVAAMLLNNSEEKPG